LLIDYINNSNQVEHSLLGDFSGSQLSDCS